MRERLKAKRAPSPVSLMLGLCVLSLTLQWVGSTGLAGARGDDGAERDRPFNATEQRKLIISRLEQLDRRLSSMESKMDHGLSVKVTEMPASYAQQATTSSDN